MKKKLGKTLLCDEVKKERNGDCGGTTDSNDGCCPLCLMVEWKME